MHGLILLGVYLTVVAVLGVVVHCIENPRTRPNHRRNPR
jgi:hypothetical protein